MSKIYGKTSVALAALFILVLGGGYLLQARSAPPAPAGTVSGTEGGTVSPTAPAQGTASASPAAPGGAPASPGTPAFTAAEVAQHASAQSCYTSISGNVYDLTSWIGQHPGGPEAILALCGTDGTAAFEAQHGGQRRPNNELASFKIGTLAP